MTGPSANSDTAISDRYWQDTFFETLGMLARGVGQEGGPDEPPKFRSYIDRPRIPLPQRVPPALGPVLAGLGDGVIDGGTWTGDAGMLGALLYYGYGFSRWDVGAVSGWPFHRMVPSARCFYPTEVYVVVGPDAGVPPGVYHYDQAHHALIELRRGDHRDQLAHATGRRTWSARITAVLTCQFWKTAFRYRHYAYRLCTQEAGMVLGNLHLVAGALGGRRSVYYQFLDGVVDDLVGARPGAERSMALLAMEPDEPGDDPGPHGPSTYPAGAPALPPVDARFRDVVADESLATDTYRMSECSVLADHRQLAARWRIAPEVGSAGPPGRHPSPQGSPEGVDLASALRSRHSGGTLFRPAEGSMPATDLVSVLAGSTASYESDLGPGPSCEVHAVAQRVDDIDPGVVRQRDGRLCRVGDMPPGRLDRALLQGPPVVDLTRSVALCYVSVDRGRATAALGNRGYRVANMDSGFVAQRLCVLAGAAGLAARPFNGYATPLVQRALGLPDSLIPTFQIALGRRTPTAQYEMPIVF